MYIGKIVVVSLDDILINNKSIEEHLEHPRLMSEEMRKN
jgi:hypothetical protein